jgi:nicotinamide-nucleotide amidase
MKTRTLSTFGLTESQAADALEDFEQAFPSIKLGFRALFPEIQIKLYLSADIQTELNDLEQQAVSWIKHTIGRNLISDTGTPLQVTIGELLKKRQATVSLAESCTGGLVAHWLTSQAGSSDYFLLSAVTYANSAKHEVLGVSWEVLQEQGAVSEAVALEMARGVQRLAASDYSLSITGIAGPSGGSPAKPVGTVCFGLAGPETLMARTKHFQFANRKMNQTMAAAYSLNLLRKLLLSTED